MTAPDREPVPAYLLQSLTSIIRAQNTRGTDTSTTPGLPEHEAMTLERLDAALIAVETQFINRMDCRDATRYADHMRAALTAYADTLTRHDTALQPIERSLAACDLQRCEAYIAALIDHPEAVALLTALTDAETGAMTVTIIATGDTPTHLRALDQSVRLAREAEVHYDLASAHPDAWTTYTTVLPHYAEARAALRYTPTAIPNGIENAAALALALAERLDTARARLAAAYTRRYRESTPAESYKGTASV